MTRKTTAEPWADTERHTHQLERVERYDGGWEISFDRGLTTVILDERNPQAVIPYVGAEYTYWGRGLGSRHRGQAIDGVVLWYLTEQEDQAEFHRQVEELRRREKDAFYDGKADYNRRVAALPELFQRRIAKFQKNNPDFDWRYGTYELKCCEDAVRIADALQTTEAIDAFSQASWDERKRLVPGINDGHSGNSFGMAVRLAHWYIKEPEKVVQMHGALAPLVGSEEYGCIPRDDEAAYPSNTRRSASATC